MISNETTEEMLLQTQADIATVCNEIQTLLIQKNRAYGDSALNPVRIFSKADAAEQIKVRLDDKLSRMASSPNAFGEDVVLDLLGYLILLRIAGMRRLRVLDMRTKSPMVGELEKNILADDAGIKKVDGPPSRRVGPVGEKHGT